MAERLGPSLDWWLEEPYAFALWSYRQLQQSDHWRQWGERVARLEAAELMHLAFNDPKRLVDERHRILSLAKRPTAERGTTDLVKYAERMARFIRKGKVLES